MATDREARALAAGEILEVEGKEYRLRPIVAQHLCDLEREAARAYKREYLETFRDNADLLGNGSAEQLIRDELQKAAAWTVADLPTKTAHDASDVPVTDALKAWAGEYADFKDAATRRKSRGETGTDEELEEQAIRAVVSTALDNGDLTVAEVEKMSGKKPRVGKVRYDQWWVTASISGMVSFLVTSLRYEHPEITKEQVAGWPLSRLMEGARIVEVLTSADVGNT